MERHTEFIDWNTQHSKNTNFPKLMYKFNANSENTASKDTR